LKKRLFFILLMLTLVILIVPTVLVSMHGDDHAVTADATAAMQAPMTAPAQEKLPFIRVYLSKEERVLELPLERYIKGVIASEMPATFHLEALKVQALVARTYIVDRLLRRDFSDMKRWGKMAETAHVTDTVQHQVFSTEAKLKQRWGKNEAKNGKRMQQAVDETHAHIITYQGKPIYAAFFSISNGRTENSEDYFQAKYPYLRGVDSLWDKQSPKYERTKTWKITDFVTQLSRQTGKKIALPVATGQPVIRVQKRTSGNRIARIQVGDEEFSGREVREALQLASSDFDWQIKGQEIVITTRGYGHGVGMSQWGAHLLAQQGKKAEEIVRHYYQGVQVEKLTQKHVNKK
jgi:stage II sporulation protein D